MTRPAIAQLTDEQLSAHIQHLDAKARSAQSELAHARRLLKKRRRGSQSVVEPLAGEASNPEAVSISCDRFRSLVSADKQLGEHSEGVGT